MASILRFRKLCYIEPVRCSSLSYDSYEKPPKDEKQSFEPSKVERKDEGIVEKVLENDKKKKGSRRQPKEWKCVDSCCWFIGYMCTTWWLLLFLYHCLPANLAGLQGPVPPGTRLKNEGLNPLHPVVLVPGIVTGGLELWEGKPCSEGLFRKRLWGGSFAEIFKRFELTLFSINLNVD